MNVGETIETEHFTFKRLKYTLKFTPKDPAMRVKLAAHGKPYTSITMNQWQDIERACPFKHRRGVQAGEPVELGERLQIPCLSWESGQSLKGKHIVERVKYMYTATNSRHNRSGRVNAEATDILTAFGVQLRMEMPGCPPEKEWSKAPPKAPRSPENLRLTKVQRILITAWTKGHNGKPRVRTLAVPFGESEAQLGHWHYVPKGGKPTYLALFECGCIEPGIQGVTVVDGKLVSDATTSDDIELVYRRTVLGGLIGNE